MSAPLVVFVTDPRMPMERTASALRELVSALGGERVVVQLRDKEASQDELLVAARTLRALTRETSARLVVNGSATVALAARADGVHIPHAGGAQLLHLVSAARGLLGPSALVTTVAHEDHDVARASDAGASAVLVSPIFESPGKGPARGVAALTRARATVDALRRESPLLLYALGGVTSANAASCVAAGADGVAAIRAIYDGAAAFGALAALEVSAAAGRSPAP